MPREKCHSVPKTVPVKKCFHVPKQHCESVPVKNPITIPKKQCWDVKAKHCHTVPVKKPRTVVKKVPKKACVSKGKNKQRNMISNLTLHLYTGHDYGQHEYHDGHGYDDHHGHGHGGYDHHDDYGHDVHHDEHGYSDHKHPVGGYIDHSGGHPHHKRMDEQMNKKVVPVYYGNDFPSSGLRTMSSINSLNIDSRRNHLPSKYGMKIVENKLVYYNPKII